jgi:hypothetical protein
MEAQQYVYLKPVRARYKQLAREFGKYWEVVRRSDSVITFNGQPGILIKSISTKVDPDHSRWVKPDEVDELLGCPVWLEDDNKQNDKKEFNAELASRAMLHIDDEHRWGIAKSNN